MAEETQHKTKMFTLTSNQKNVNYNQTELAFQSMRKPNNFRVQVAHICNLSYPGGRDEEDHSSKPARANSLRDPIMKTSSQKMGW
jgi:hypothetical protein